MLKVINSSFYALYHILLRLLTLFFVVFGFFPLFSPSTAGTSFFKV